MVNRGKITQLHRRLTIDPNAGTHYLFFDEFNPTQCWKTKEETTIEACTACASDNCRIIIVEDATIEDINEE